ncbi:MAG TPA: DUF2298 domain-containing protein, partial [Promineifilum sp.]|nr:DUF2298 domain-containing protein [Promineifilum sp.]
MTTDILSAIRWWAALTILGLAALPLVYSLLRRLPDRGYAFLRPAGLLLVGWVYWLAGTLGFAGNDGGGVVLALLVVAALSWLAWRRRPNTDPPLRDWLRDNRNTVIATELVFAAVFALWVWVRMQNPAISATEKPMEFAFLNGVGRSATFPPLDPWLSGFGISYYYFGYVMVSLLGRLAFVAEPQAFNLAIAWLVAGTATGAFGIVVNLISLRRITNDDSCRPTKLRITNEERALHSPLVIRNSSLILGLLAALAIPIAGNMQMGLELLHGNGAGSPALWAWLDVRDIDGPAETTEPARYETSGWWWWRTSRVIHEYHLSGRAEEGLEPIVEIPAFSFILGDMHPHVLALPFAFLSMAVALAWLLEITNYELRITNSEARSSLVSRISYLVSGKVGVPLSLWLFTALVLGGLSFLNTWDVAIHLFLVAGAFFLGHWYRAGTTRGLWGRSALVGVALAAAAVVLYLPFYLGFRSQAGAPFILPFLMRPTRLVQFLIIFGLPLLAITVWLVVMAARQRFRHWRTGVGIAAMLVLGLLAVMLLWTWLLATSPEFGRVAGVAQELGLTLPPRPDGAIEPAWGAQVVAALLPSLFAARLASPWLALYLGGLLALVVMVLREKVGEENPQISQTEEENPQISQISQIEEEGEDDGDARHSPLTTDHRPLTTDHRPLATVFALLLVLTGVLLTLGPEFVYLRDNFGVRLNTTFKFYYQAWAMFGVAAVFGLEYLWATRRRSAAARATALITAGAYVALLAVALLFPVYAARSRAAEYRGPARATDGSPLERQPATLDGLAWLARYNPAEHEAIMWLRQQAEAVDGPPPVVLEAVGGQYSGYGRVSANTGLPTVLGWPGHELQWRGSDHAEPGRREPLVGQIYTATDLSLAGALLDRFNVRYIYVGDLEREKYGPVGLEKFGEALDVAFA